jgi:hypothetical protein
MQIRVRRRVLTRASLRLVADRLKVIQETNLDFVTHLRRVIGHIHRKGNRHIFFAPIMP